MGAVASIPRGRPTIPHQARQVGREEPRLLGMQPYRGRGEDQRRQQTQCRIGERSHDHWRIARAHVFAADVLFAIGKCSDVDARHAASDR